MLRKAWGWLWQRWPWCIVAYHIHVIWVSRALHLTNRARESPCRNPRSRLVSHMKFVMWTMSGQRGYNDTRLFNMMYGNRTSRFWQVGLHRAPR